MSLEPTTLGPVTAAERGRLADLEGTISKGLGTFVEVGTALAEVRDGRLYRDGCGTFEAYCASRWGLSRSSAYELMSAAEVVSGIPDTAPRPLNVDQARALAAAPPEERGEVMEKVAAGGKPTTKAITETIRAKHPKPEPTPYPRCVTCGAVKGKPTQPQCDTCRTAKKVCAGGCGTVLDARSYVGDDGLCADCFEPPAEPKAAPAPRPLRPVPATKAEEDKQERRLNTRAMCHGLSTLAAGLEVAGHADRLAAGWDHHEAENSLIRQMRWVATPAGMRKVADMLCDFADLWESTTKEATG